MGGESGASGEKGASGLSGIGETLGQIIGELTGNGEHLTGGAKPRNGFPVIIKASCAPTILAAVPSSSLSSRSMAMGSLGILKPNMSGGFTPHVSGDEGTRRSNGALGPDAASLGGWKPRMCLGSEPGMMGGLPPAVVTRFSGSRALAAGSAVGGGAFGAKGRGKAADDGVHCGFGKCVGAAMRADGGGGGAKVVVCCEGWGVAAEEVVVVVTVTRSATEQFEDESCVVVVVEEGGTRGGASVWEERRT